MAVEAAFRRAIARYRPTSTIEQLFNDPHFIKLVNAYLTLSGPLRAAYDRQQQHTKKRGQAGKRPEATPPPRPFDEFTPREVQLFTARIASWRHEPLEAIHLLQRLLQQEPGYAPAWALLGEVFFIVGRLEEGVHAYQNAVQAEPANRNFIERLQHAGDALAGKVILQVELSPEEALLREERHKRRHISAALLLAGVAVITLTFLTCHLHPSSPLYIPWHILFRVAMGTCVLFVGLGYGRWLEPFERVMLWSTLPAGDRGTIRNYPIGLLLLVTAAASLWLSVLALLVMALMDEEWPDSPSIMLGACTLLTLIITLLVYVNTAHQHWVGMLLLGGNLLVLAAMLGWWIGSLNILE